MGHRDEVILTKILSEISIAQEMLGVLSLAEFEANELLKRAICMTVINIGELVKNLSDECREKCPAVRCVPIPDGKRVQCGYPHANPALRLYPLD